MKLSEALRITALAVLALTMVAGCATQPKPGMDDDDEGMPSARADRAAEAIAAAQAAIEDAEALNGWVWRDTEDFLGAARKAADAGDTDKAIKLAEKARKQAELAQNQYYLEESKFLLEEVEAYGGLNDDQQARLDQARRAVMAAEGRRAYDLLKQLAAELRAASIQYTVVRGDSLWGISGDPDVYDDPYRWPLIYKANRGKIKDADLIYPGQVFSIDRNPSAEEVSRAVRHAKTRGAWSLGEVEESDRGYLGELRIR